MRRELDRWSLCKRFVHQFALIAKPRPGPRVKKRKVRRGGEAGGREVRMWRPAPPRKHQPRGLAAVKHGQMAAEHNRRVVRAFGAVAAVQMAARADWPDEMKRDLQAAKTAEQHQRWVEKWALHLSGQAMSGGEPKRPDFLLRRWRRDATQ